MDIIESPAGKIIEASTGYQAFIPNDLPPSITWSTDLVNSLSAANYALGKLSAEGSKLPNPHLLIRPFIAKEAVLSSKIEGTQATLSEVLANEVGSDVNINQDDLQEVQNYMLALDFGLQRLKELPLSLRLIKEIHLKLMNGVRGSHATPGEFRRTQNWIGNPGCTLNTAKYVPPTPEIMLNCLNSFESFLHDRTLPPLIHIALCHYQFESIHPFLDGNGRIGRLLISLILIERNLLSTPILYLSAFFEATKQEYYRLLFNVSSKGSWEEWLLYFLNGVATQSLDVFYRAERINSLISNWQKTAATDIGGISPEIVKYLAVNPYLTTNKIADTFNVAYTTAQRVILKLEKQGVITQISDRKRDRIYCASEIMNILEEPTELSISFNEISES